ncbi:LysE family translocator [Pseudovibrio flavus]|uniref:LysE family translocator n=1 Tax=Pseudovibrio flavus TaxID=2529854 RepID=UPI00211C51C7|nr:LysE family translocator [Pseudovibrio flavus]
MSWEHWSAFVLASVVVLAIPGPTILLVISYALGQGRRSAVATVSGSSLGDFVAITASLLGAGAILAASSTLFTLLKLVGAAYLVWLGIKMWRAPTLTRDIKAAGAHTPLRKIFGNCFLVTALNPKSIIFFTAFVPQFVDPASALTPQFVTLIVTFVSLATINAVMWAMMAGSLRVHFQKPTAMKIANRIGGGFLVSAGLLTAAVQRA